jgi:hypothetical protein
MVGRVVEIDVRVVLVPQHECKLYAAAPVVGDVVRVEAVFEIDGALVEDVVAEGEEEDPPVSGFSNFFE